MGILDSLFKSKAEREYDRAMKTLEFDRALAVAKETGMDGSKVVDAAKAWLDKEWNTGNYERAAQIGMEYRLSKKRTVEAADKALDAALTAKDLDKALQLVATYELDRRKLVVASDKLYQHEIDAEQFRAAADVARRGGLDRERIERAVTRALKKAIRDKDDATIAELGLDYADFELDWEKVRQSRINLVVGQLTAQVYGKAIDVATRHKLGEGDVAEAFQQAAASRHKYLENLRSSMVVKEGKSQPRPQTVEEIRADLEAGYRKELEKRAAAAAAAAAKPPDEEEE